MAVNYLQDYLGIDPNDYSAMEQGIAGISPLAPGQSIIPQAPVMPRASIMSEDDFASATAPLMDRVYQREAEGRERAEGLTNELQALQEEMAQTSEAEIQKRADLERQIQNIMQERDVSRNFAEDLENQIQGIMEELGVSRSEAENLAGQLETTTQERDASRASAEDLEGQIQNIMEQLGVSRSEAENLAGQLKTTTQERDTSMQSAEGLATELQDVQANLQEITQLRDTALQDYQDAVAQQDIIRQQAAENQAIQLEEQRNSLLEEREGIITTLEQDFGVQRSELESVIGGLEGQVGDLTSKVGELESVRGNLQSEIDNLSSQMQSLEVEKQDAIAQQDVIRAESAQAQQDALAQQGDQFATEKSALEQQIADLTAQVSQQQPPEITMVEDEPPSTDIPGGGTPGFYDNQPPSKGPPQLFIDDGPGFRDEKIGMPPSINEGMPPATGEGGLPEGYSYKPGPGSEGMAYTTVMPSPGFRYAYGPDGDRIEVPDNRTGDTGSVPIAKPIDRIVKPPLMPPKDFRDERIGMPPPPPPITPPTREKLLPPTIMPPLPPQIGRPPLRREKPIPLRPREELIDEGFIPPEKIGRPPREDIVPIRNQDDFLPRLPIQQPPQKPISIGGVGGGRGIIGKNPIIGSGTGGIGARPDLPPPTTGGFKPFFGSKKPTKVPMKPPSIGGFGGMSGRRSMRPMMRAGGGTISQAIADLQNRLR